MSHLVTKFPDNEERSMPKMKQRWTDERLEELTQLADLLRDVASLDRGNNFLSKAGRCIDSADQLCKSDLRAKKRSFIIFLEELAREEMEESNGAPFPLTDHESRALDAASVAMGGVPDALSLMNSLCQWPKPPPQDERWVRKIASACEIAVAFCKLAQNYKARIRE